MLRVETLKSILLRLPGLNVIYVKIILNYDISYFNYKLLTITSSLSIYNYITVIN